MAALRQLLKPIVTPLVHPFRGSVTWACQRGILSAEARRFFPWGWVTEPFTIHGDGWSCRWFPTDFDTVGHRIFWSGFHQWEKETVPVILDHLRRSKCFMDIGANCGIYTVLGCTVNPQLKAVSIEPVPKISAALKNNIERNGFSPRVQVLNLAVGDCNGVVPFHEAEDATQGSLAEQGYAGQKGNLIQVRCTTLDALVEELKIEPDFLKIDVEGFEHAVVKGATGVLKRFRPRIVLEANPTDPADVVTEVLSAAGYNFYNITDRGPVQRPTVDPVHEFRNWLCIPA
jgi:FkbM family methyltransferase